MLRHAFALAVNYGCFESFRIQLGKSWQEITALLDKTGAGNFSLWSADTLMFGYYETDEKVQLSGETRAAFDTIMNTFEGLVTWISPPDEEMRLMYQDFGVVRKNKELIRHRVFITRLSPGAQEEYKRRHDALCDARGDKVNPGPDSNFSIWNAGDYIFGYDEIDTTMEKAETEESLEKTVEWESRMLEIMDWVTDDVDWITDERHEHIKRLGFHG
ncbi:MAG: L-rhamnose mutarotase [Lachnospiraceae bacterium]|nr:L-rhamnose mutarotase [Lachnospiraceae bacterium]